MIGYVRGSVKVCSTTILELVNKFAEIATLSYNQIKANLTERQGPKVTGLRF
jgi:hypothetical protein